MLRNLRKPKNRIRKEGVQKEVLNAKESLVPKRKELFNNAFAQGITPQVPAEFPKYLFACQSMPTPTRPMVF